MLPLWAFELFDLQYNLQKKKSKGISSAHLKICDIFYCIISISSPREVDYESTCFVEKSNFESETWYGFTIDFIDDIAQ